MASGSLQFSTVSPSDLPALAHVLQEAGLPSNGVSCLTAGGPVDRLRLPGGVMYPRLLSQGDADQYVLPQVLGNAGLTKK